MTPTTASSLQRQLHKSVLLVLLSTMFSASRHAVLGFTARHTATRSVSSSALRFAQEGQAEVVLVGCGAPNRGMGW